MKYFGWTTIFVSTYFLLSSVYACRCIKPDVNKMDEFSEIVFIGKVKSKTGFLSSSKNRFLFSDLEVMKGENQNEIEIWSNKQESACGLHYIDGKEYLVFVTNRDGKLTSGLCSSWPINGIDQDFLQSVRDKYSANQAINFARQYAIH